MTTKRIQFPVYSIRIGNYYPIEFHPEGIQVGLEIPVDDDHMVNAKEVLENEKDGIGITPILTVDGLQWCYNQLRKVFPETTIQQPTKSATTDDSNADEDWE